jgi:hypothetical protein
VILTAAGIVNFYNATGIKGIAVLGRIDQGFLQTQAHFGFPRVRDCLQEQLQHGL